MESLFSLLRQAFLKGVRGVSPEESVASSLTCEGGTLRVRRGEEWIDISPGRGGELYFIATGKAAPGMYRGALSVAGVPHRGVIATLECDGTLPGATIFRCGHPLPDEGSTEAAKAILATVRGIRPQDTLVYLLSGGSSSMVALPVNGVSFPDKVETVREVMNGGASITELNIVRTALSAVKGGKIGSALKTDRACVLLISDVPGNDLSIIGSGPLYRAPLSTSPLQVLEHLSVTPSIPPSVLQYLRAEQGRAAAKVPKNILHTIVAHNRMALESAAAMLASRNYKVLISDDLYQGEARTTGYVMAERILRSRKILRAPKNAFVAGGETVVTVRGNGSGGRNQEMAMGAALRLEGTSGVVGLCAATDGIDGISPAAGGFFDGFQVGRARRMGMEHERYLADNDSFHFLEKIGYSFQTGPTGTNVMDLTICLLHHPP